MRAMRAERFSGYEALRLVDLPKPAVTDGKVLVRITAAGVTPLDHTILVGDFHIPEKPLILGNEGAGVVEDGGGAEFHAGSRVMFWGVYGAFEDGTYCEWIAVRKEDLCLIPDNVDDISAAGVPVAYLTAQVALTLAGFRSGKTVLAPAIGGSVGNAVTQLARAQGAKYAISSTTNHKKAEQAKALGFDEVIDLSGETLRAGVRRITAGHGADIVYNTVGSPYFERANLAMAVRATQILISTIERPVAFDIFTFYRGQHTYVGIDTLAFDAREGAAILDMLLPAFELGALKPFPIHDECVFALDDAARAYQAVFRGATHRVLLKP